MSDEWSEGEASVAGAGSHSPRCFDGRQHHEIRTPPIYSYETLSWHLLIFSVADGGLLKIRQQSLQPVCEILTCSGVLLMPEEN